ncbi:hypothetical protein AB4259_04490 [Vibrio amylolyticus]|uniref:hypothetical protein n=1 Tax=Vibrio amylolyticus TaxID=2847292 RepID=UPI003550E143
MSLSQMMMLESDKSRALAEAEVSLTIAHTDPLTQLPNWHTLEKRLAPVMLASVLAVLTLKIMSVHNKQLRLLIKQCT